MTSRRVVDHVTLGGAVSPPFRVAPPPSLANIALANIALANITLGNTAVADPMTDRRFDARGGRQRRLNNARVLRRADDHRPDDYNPGNHKPAVIPEPVEQPAEIPAAVAEPERKRLSLSAVSWAIRLVDMLLIVASGTVTYWLQSEFNGLPDPTIAFAALAIVAIAARSPKAKPESLREFAAQPRSRLITDCVVRTLAPFAASLAMIAVLMPGAGAVEGPLVTWLWQWGLGAAAGVTGARLILSGLIARWRNQGRLKQAVAIFGTGDLAARLLERLHATCADSIELVGVFDDRRRPGASHLRDLVRGNTNDLIELSRQRQIDRVIVALPHSAEQRVVEVLHKLHQMPVEISLAPDMVGFSVAGKDSAEFGGLPLIDVYGRPLSFGQNLAKNVFDVVVAAVALVVATPVLVATAIAIKLDSKGPVLFRQNRLGFGDRVIQVYKFRSMYHEAADLNGERQSSKNDPRITRIGHFLRKSSLDELPQLFNVLRGEMSLVGPRPHAVAMKVEHRRNEDIVPDYALRHHVKPGITGWAQVNGHNGPVDTEEALRARVAHDLDYINNWSLWFDIRSLFLTIKVFVSQRHAY